MRKILLVVALGGLGLSVQGAGPQKIVFARVFPNAGQIGLFIARADGTDEHPLLGPPSMDYDPTWAPDGASIVFTSDRNGSADLYRVKPDGSGLERLTDSPAYDDQAAFSPDGRRLVFVSTRAATTADLWTMDVQTRKATPLTSGPGGDFRPSWSPDGQWIAFSSDRENTLPFAHGRWEPLQLADLYLVHPDGSGLKRLSPHGNFCGSPKWTADSRQVIAYCMGAEDTLETRRPSPLPGHDTKLLSFDIASGASTELPSGPGVKFAPSPVGSSVGYIRKDAQGTGAGIYYADGRRGPVGDIRSAAWSPDGTRVVFHRRLAATPPTWTHLWSKNPEYDLTLSGGILPSFNLRDGRLVITMRPPVGTVFGSSIAVTKPGSDALNVIYRDPARNVLAPQWSPSGDTIVFSVGTFNAFYNGFNGLFLKAGDRAEGGAQVAMIKPDGSGFREVTTGPNNNAFPSMAPDGKRVVYRSFGPGGEDGLKILNIDTGAITTLTTEYDNFPLWSPRGDLIMFSRFADGEYDIYTIKPDGIGVKRLTNSHGNDAHMAWSPDGTHIVFASARMGFKDEMTYTDAPQPYGEIFVMRADGSGVEQITDNQWEEGTPAWQPSPRP